MMYVVAFALVLAYVILAVVVARFCGVNRGWEEAVDDMPEDFPFREIPSVVPARKPVALKA
ncbi:MAG: hypothetical protein ACKVU1_17900 [bacterium]